MLNENYVDKHMKREKKKTKCTLCDMQVENLKEHEACMHKICSNCKKLFKDFATLKQHELNCQAIIEDSDEDEITSNHNFSINQGELGLASTLIKLLEKSSLNSTEIQNGKRAIIKYSSEQRLEKSRQREDCFLTHRSQALFFDLPIFSTDGKPNFNKSYSIISLRRMES